MHIFKYQSIRSETTTSIIKISDGTQFNFKNLHFDKKQRKL